jgi:cysteine desulfurase/selenocysteine lyase
MLRAQMQGKPLMYLDSAATALKPRCVIEALRAFYAEEYGTVHRAVYALAGAATARYEGVRRTVQRFLNAAHPEEVVFTKGTTEGINLVASAFGEAFVRAGDEILISEMEHHSNIVPWQLLCARTGAKLLAVPANDRGELILEEYERLLTEKTRLVSIAHIANATGTENPVGQIIAMAHVKGAKVLVDGAQSAPHMPVDVQQLDADFYVFSGHKAFGPTGVGVLYGKKALLEAMPPYQGGGDMIETVTMERTAFQRPPLKFEAGTPMIASVIGLGAALDFIESLGRARIAAHEQELLACASQALSAVPGLAILGTAQKKGAILTFTVAGVHPLDVGALLDAQGIAVRTGHLCAQPALRRFGVSSAVRASFAPYNTREEIERFACVLQEIIRSLT